MDSITYLDLNRFYTTIYCIIRDISERQKQQVCTFNKNPTSLVAYDNYDFVIGRRDERTSDQREHRSIITTLSFSGQNIPAKDLRQSM